MAIQISATEANTDRATIVVLERRESAGLNRFLCTKSRCVVGSDESTLCYPRRSR